VKYVIIGAASSGLIGATRGRGAGFT
jgi:hypothetical protein